MSSTLDETASGTPEERLCRLERQMAEIAPTLRRLQIFAKACWAGAAQLADESLVEVDEDALLVCPESDV